MIRFKCGHLVNGVEQVIYVNECDKIAWSYILGKNQICFYQVMEY